jgi:hypothetical protein
VARGGYAVKGDETVVADEAVTITIVTLATVLTDAGNVALVLPAGIVTELGTDATAVLPLESGITTPPVGAAVVAVTVPVARRPLPMTRSASAFPSLEIYMYDSDGAQLLYTYDSKGAGTNFTDLNRTIYLNDK